MIGGRREGERERGDLRFKDSFGRKRGRKTSSSHFRPFVFGEEEESRRQKMVTFFLLMVDEKPVVVFDYFFSREMVLPFFNSPSPFSSLLPPGPCFGRPQSFRGKKKIGLLLCVKCE